MKSPRTIRDAAAERIYALLLRAYPSAFRDEFGSGLRSTYLDWYRGRTQGATGLIAFSAPAASVRFDLRAALTTPLWP